MTTTTQTRLERLGATALAALHGQAAADAAMIAADGRDVPAAAKDRARASLLLARQAYPGLTRAEAAELATLAPSL